MAQRNTLFQTLVTQGTIVMGFVDNRKKYGISLSLIL